MLLCAALMLCAALVSAAAKPYQQPLQPPNSTSADQLGINDESAFPSAGVSTKASRGCIVVLADYNEPGSVAHVHERLRNSATDCRISMFTKGPGGCAASVGDLTGISCTELPNRGREGHTFLSYTVRHYDDLPERLIFLPSNLDKHPQRENLLDAVMPVQRLLDVALQERETELKLRALKTMERTRGSVDQAAFQEPQTFSCINLDLANTLEQVVSAPGYDPALVRTFHPDDTSWCQYHPGVDDDNHHIGCMDFSWGGAGLLPATPAPLHAWVEEHLNPDEPLCNALVCQLGASATTRDLVRARPKAEYERLLAEFEKIELEQDGECGHYMERLHQLIFAKPTVPMGGKCPP